MASGQKRVVINSLERATSTDINRAQAFLGRHAAELFRWMVAYEQGETGNGAPFSGTNPLGGIILNGILPRPELGTTNLFIEEGIALIHNPDGSPSSDDSPFKVIIDAGVQTAGALTLTAGAGSTRIDVIECQRSASITDETASRDIYNPANGTFTASLVTKVQSDKLTYRIRTGVAGAGFPGTASGWLPLAVVRVPNTATTWNDCDLWDVRPLASALRLTPFNVAAKFPKFIRNYLSVVEKVAGTTVEANGIVEVEYKNWLLGGELSAYSSGGINLLGTDVLEPGFASVAGRPWYLYLLMPFGLPRWCKYSPSSAGFRRPTGLSGIPTFTQKAPSSHRLQPSSAISLPTNTGLGSSTSEAVAVFAGGYSDVNVFQNAYAVGDGWTFIGREDPGHASGIEFSPAVGNNTSAPRYDITDGTHFPVGATAIKARFMNTLTSSVPGSLGKIEHGVRLYDEDNNYKMTVWEHSKAVAAATAGSWQEEFEVIIPLVALGTMPSGTPITRQISLIFAPTSLGTITYSQQSMIICGWKMGL